MIAPRGLAAERELVSKPAIELRQKNNQFELTGFRRPSRVSGTHRRHWWPQLVSVPW
jgi:hypothetical protein